MVFLGQVEREGRTGQRKHPDKMGEGFVGNRRQDLRFCSNDYIIPLHFIL